ncbi:MAG: hypothetical protein FI679_01695 [SAR202 cluster bacterium]|jgi:spermidine synthase|nr:hypothetical protein [Chloroflexota bacterium]MCH2522588.1 hypothetical protein [Dehalococcoidia bacterium]MQG84595.1 hypothetical protein [SAR202 cluster bacterium]|tara:strand:+ start:390 stop:953 length:564 start_codon:yes stop_codon:yes gene_type:complete
MSTKKLKLKRIPEGRSGHFSIIHRYHPHLYFNGKYIRYTGAMLIDNETMWMSDGPEERLTMSSAVRWCPNNADVLIGGLGLGIVPRWLEQKANSITIVEFSRDVINLVYDYIKTAKMKIIHDDINNYLDKTEEKFDFVYLDTWPDLDASRLDEITHLKKLSKNVLKNENSRVICWGENVVRKAATKV